MCSNMKAMPQMMKGGTPDDTAEKCSRRPDSSAAGKNQLYNNVTVAKFVPWPKVFQHA